MNSPRGELEIFRLGIASMHDVDTRAVLLPDDSAVKNYGALRCAAFTFAVIGEFVAAL